jgi:hypothetical protein
MYTVVTCDLQIETCKFQEPFVAMYDVYMYVETRPPVQLLQQVAQKLFHGAAADRQESNREGRRASTHY